MNAAVELYDSSLNYLGTEGHPRYASRAFPLNEQAVALGYPNAIPAMDWQLCHA